VGPGVIVYRAARAGTDGLCKLAEGTSTHAVSGLDGRARVDPARHRARRSTASPSWCSDGGGRKLYVMKRGRKRCSAALAEDLEVRGSAGLGRRDGQWWPSPPTASGEPRLYKIPGRGGPRPFCS
jgi:hypothetical protein